MRNDRTHFHHHSLQQLFLQWKFCQFGCTAVMWLTDAVVLPSPQIQWTWDAFCGGVTFTIINLSNSRKTAREIIFIPQVFWRLYVSLIHTIGLGWDQIVWCEPKPVHCSGTPYQHPTGSDRVSPFDCCPCQVQCWHGWRSLLSLGKSLYSHPCACGPARKCLPGSQLWAMALACVILAENEATAGYSCWSLNGVLW